MFSSLSLSLADCSLLDLLNLFKSLKASSLYLSWKKFASYFSFCLVWEFDLSSSLSLSLEVFSLLEVLNLFKSLKASSLYLSWKKFASYFSFCLVWEFDLSSSLSLSLEIFSLLEVLNLFKSLKASSLYFSWKKFVSYFSFLFRIFDSLFCKISSLFVTLSLFSNPISWFLSLESLTSIGEESFWSFDFILESSERFEDFSFFSSSLSLSKSLLRLLDEEILDLNFLTSEKTELMLSLLRYIFILSRMFKELRASL